MIAPLARAASRPAEAGYTFVELLVVSVILLILASAIAPLSHTTIQRQREVELRRALREIRTAIDAYKDAVDSGEIGGANLDAENEGYPPSLETLVEGVEALDGVSGTPAAVIRSTSAQAGRVEGPGGASGRRIRFLRRIPVDPFTRSADWRLRAYQDSPTARRWGGGNVYDVRSRARGTALDGTRYEDW